MSANTKIEWTEDSLNPIRARNKETGVIGHYCVHVSPGCEHCYAEGLQTWPIGSGIEYTAQYRDKVEVFLDHDVLLRTLRRRKPRNVFVCSMTDLFGDFVHDEMIDKVFAVMAMSPQHIFQVLTKRPARMAAYLRQIEAEKDMQRWINAAQDMNAPGDCIGYLERECDWPLPNVWFGISAEDQRRFDERWQHFCGPEFHGWQLWLSAEPLLEGIDIRAAMPNKLWAGLESWQGGELKWVVVGGESGSGARPFDIAWAESLRDQCRAAGVPYFLKQLGARPIFRGLWEGPWAIKHSKGGDMAEWPEGLRVREYPH